jgi:hypothetical protein
MSRGRWGTFSYYDAPPRRAVEGGVVVARPGKVSDPLAAELVTAAEMESAPQILARGRTYARAGQVVALQVKPGGFSAQIQGTKATPYEVRLDRTTISGSDRVAADCTCPYGCEDGWCKHAAALAYVAAFLLDRDPTARAAWTGAPPTTTSSDPGIPGTIADTAVVPASALTLDPDDLATLRNPPPQQDAHELLAAAEALVPHPWRLAAPSEANHRSAD